MASTSTPRNTLKVINRASLISATINATLAVLKILFGIMGLSYALVTDGIHSLSDVVIDGLVVISARIGQTAPDEDHPYGHRRIETIGTVVISLIILGVGISMLAENALRIIHHTQAQRPMPIVFAVALLSVIANEWLYRYMLKKSLEINSPLLKSNASHNRSDALTSVIVIVSAVFSWFGWHEIDAIAAIIISAFIIKMGCHYTWHSLKELVDSGVDANLAQQLEKTIESTPGVLALHQLRTRMHADKLLLDGHVQVAPKLSVSEGHLIGTTVYQRIRQIAPNLLDATIHIDVEDDDDAYLKKTKLPANREIILGHMEYQKERLPGFNQLKNLTLHYLNQKIEVEILLPLSLLNNCNYDDIVLQYSSCLCELPDLKSVAINFFRD